jgi:hypothetical protein
MNTKLFRAVFWVVLPCKMIVDRRFRGTYCLHHQASSLNSSEHHTRRRENLKSHNTKLHSASNESERLGVANYIHISTVIRETNLLALLNKDVNIVTTESQFRDNMQV